MTHHYPDLTSACDWLNQISHAAWPIKSTTQIWVVIHHQCGISALISQMSFGRPGKPVVVSPNVGCFLRLLFVQPVSIIAKFNISTTRFHWAGGMLGCHETTSEEGAAEILYWWHITTQIWDVILFVWGKLPHGTTNQKHNLDPRQLVIGMKFSSLFYGHYFMGKPAVA